MLLIEYRILMPLSLDEYEIGEKFTISEISKSETSKEEGIEIMHRETFKNNPLLNGQYSEGELIVKKYSFEKRFPDFIKRVIPKGSLVVEEKFWNAYPFCRSEISNPLYMGENFSMCIDSLHCADRGTDTNVFNLNEEELQIRRVIHLDIANDPLPEEDTANNPRVFKSQTTGRGPLTENWKETTNPIMCVYKLVRISFQWFGIETRAETYIAEKYQQLFLHICRNIVCSMDSWMILSMEDVQKLEDEAANVLKSVQEEKDKDAYDL